MQHSQNKGQACLRQGGSEVKLRSKGMVPTNTTWEQANIHSEKKTRGVVAAHPLPPKSNSLLKDAQHTRTQQYQHNVKATKLQTSCLM